MSVPIERSLERVPGAMTIAPLLGTLIPLLVGAILGSLDPDMRKWLGGATGVLIPFFAFALGAGI